MKICCKKCQGQYDFLKRWFKTNDQDNFICRKCKIKAKTQSPEFKAKASAKSKLMLSDPNIKARMSQLATLNNIKNAHKISESLKKYYSNQENKNDVSSSSLNNWKDQEYKESVSNGLSKKWEDPTYRGKILGNREHYRPSNKKLSKQLDLLGLNYKTDFILSSYEFDALIMGKYLYDEQPSSEKRLFVEHYYKQYIYIDNLEVIQFDGLEL